MIYETLGVHTESLLTPSLPFTRWMTRYPVPRRQCLSDRRLWSVLVLNPESVPYRVGQRRGLMGDPTGFRLKRISGCSLPRTEPTPDRGVDLDFFLTSCPHVPVTSRETERRDRRREPSRSQERRTQSPLPGSDLTSESG